MSDVIQELFKVISARKASADEGSYTGYLFSSGLDKILKKCGEECTETVIAAKNGNAADIVNETCDLLYHLLVMLCQCGIDISDIEAELETRLKKQGNLKPSKQTDKNS